MRAEEQIADKKAQNRIPEELQLFIPPDALTLGWHGSKRFESREDTVTIWEIVLDAPPPLRVDGRELVWADWKTPAEARALRLLPHLQDYLAGR